MLTSDEEIDESLFTVVVHEMLNEEGIEKRELDRQLTVSPQKTLAVLDITLVWSSTPSLSIIHRSTSMSLSFQDWLRYWLPLGSRSDQCLNLASAKECTSSCVILLEARGHHRRAFELLESRLRDAIERGAMDEEELC